MQLNLGQVFVYLFKSNLLIYAYLCRDYVFLRTIVIYYCINTLLYIVFQYRILIGLNRMLCGLNITPPSSGYKNLYIHNWREYDDKVTLTNLLYTHNLFLLILTMARLWAVNKMINTK